MSLTVFLDSLPVEVLAHSLEWTSEREWLQLRALSRKWWSAVTCLMEGELTAQTSAEGVWKPTARRTIPRRLLLVSAPFMSTEVLTAVVTVHFGDRCSFRSHRCDMVSKQEVTLIADSFPALESLFCPVTVTDKALKDVTIRAPLMKSLDLLEGRVTDVGMGEVSQLSTLTSLNLTGCEKITDKGLGAVAALSLLSSLCLKYCALITDAGLAEVVKLGSLTSLGLSWCRGITDAGLAEIATPTKVPEACSSTIDPEWFTPCDHLPLG